MYCPRCAYPTDNSIEQNFCPNCKQVLTQVPRTPAGEVDQETVTLRNVTPYLQEFRECARSLWNTYFRILEVDASCHFAQLTDQFFSALVLEQIGAPPQLYTYTYPEPFSCLRVVPMAIADVPIMINRPSEDGNRYWDDPVNQVQQSDVDLRFINYFDFDQQGYLDYKYYLVRIVAFAAHPHLVDRDALIEVQYANVYFDDQVSGP